MRRKITFLFVLLVSLQTSWVFAGRRKNPYFMLERKYASSLKKGVDTSIKGMTQLQRSAERGNMIEVNFWILKGVSLNLLSDKHGFTALDYAIINNKIELAARLIFCGAKTAEEILNE